jgi:hypothetical protein
MPGIKSCMERVKRFKIWTGRFTITLYKMHTEFSSGSLGGRDPLEDLGLDGRIKLK